MTFSRSPLYKAMLALLVVLAVVLTSAPVYAQSGSDGRLNTRRLDSFDSGEYDWDLSAELGEILTATADTDLYDPITIANLRILRDKAQPYWSEDDIDPERTRRVVRKALAIQSAHVLVPVIKESDLGDVFLQIKRGFKRLSDLFRYSLQDEPGAAVSLSRENKGRKLLELDLKFSLKKGVDPQIRINDEVRFRYDFSEQATFLEYGFDF